MYYVNILSSSNNPIFLRQFDSRKFGTQYHFFENSKENRLWDYVVVYEEIKTPISLKVKKGGLIFFSGESQDSRFYSSAFLRQFDHCVTTHTTKQKMGTHIYAQTALNWHFGYDCKLKKFNFNFNDIMHMAPPKKSKNISVITSSLLMMFGHAKRLYFINLLRNRYGDRIDFFGKGVRFIDDKAQALLPYRFHICIENSEKPHYWTEKFADALLGFCVPIYFGDPQITQYFPSDSFIKIDINKPKDAFYIIDKILQSPEALYNKMLPAVMLARKKLINEYNFFPVFANYIESGTFASKNIKEQILLRPNKEFLSAKIGMLCLRARRLFFRVTFKLFFK